MIKNQDAWFLLKVQYNVYRKAFSCCANKCYSTKVGCCLCLIKASAWFIQKISKRKSSTLSHCWQLQHGSLHILFTSGCQEKARFEEVHECKYWQTHPYLYAEQTDIISSPQHTETFHRVRLSQGFVLAAAEGSVRRSNILPEVSAFQHVRERSHLSLITQQTWQPVLQPKAYFGGPEL